MSSTLHRAFQSSLPKSFCFRSHSRAYLLATLDGGASIARGFCDGVQETITELDFTAYKVDDITHLLERVGLEINDSQAILEGAKQLIEFGGGKDEVLLGKSKAKIVLHDGTPCMYPSQC